ncbi:MAG: MBL fold metallo-hydrolase, partial [Candidatus Methanomethylophilaceae archaeon]|nr:MBL fold metallo-hydrolase [Candidatus Methanomethylophilaceae archaeon]
MERRYFVARMPDEPGSLHRAAAVLKRHRGNIERIQYDQRIDPQTVFFEVLISEECFDDAMQELEGMGYLRRSLSEPVYLKFEVQLPQAEGALFDFLDGITSTRSNISFLDFDVTGGEPDALRVGIVLDDQC